MNDFESRLAETGNWRLRQQLCKLLEEVETTARWSLNKVETKATEGLVELLQDAQENVSRALALAEEPFKGEKTP